LARELALKPRVAAGDASKESVCGRAGADAPPHCSSRARLLPWLLSLLAGYRLPPIPILAAACSLSCSRRLTSLPCLLATSSSSTCTCVSSSRSVLAAGLFVLHRKGIMARDGSLQVATGRRRIQIHLSWTFWFVAATRRSPLLFFFKGGR
jgi:hypothetical protein